MKIGASQIIFNLATLSNCGKLLIALCYQTLLVIESVAELITLGMVKMQRDWTIRSQTPNSNAEVRSSTTIWKWGRDVTSFP